MKYLILIWTLMTIIACGGSGKGDSKHIEDELVSLEQEVMQIHDESMAYMEDLNNYHKKVVARLKEQVPAEDSLLLVQARDQLAEADSLMWDWMYAYKKPLDGTPSDEVRAYFESEKLKIKIVEQRMKSAMDEADKLLRKEN